MNPVQTDWTRLYGLSWKGTIEDDSFAHPAKFARGLIRQIYDHMVDEEGWLQPGDTVLDPFGGVALGAWPALMYRLRWVGMELEERFVLMGNRNIQSWEHTYKAGGYPYHSAYLYHGDSRYLGLLLDRRANGCVSSPPFEQSLDRGVVDPEERVKLAREMGISNAEHISPIDMERVGKRTQEYGSTAGQLGAERGDTFWAAARQVLEQTYQVLAPGAHAVWVCKDYVRDGQRVPFAHQWAQLCESVGFIWLHEHRAWVVEHYGVQMALFGDDKPIVKERKSFFRRLAEKNGAPGIDWESVLCFRKG